MAMNCQRKHAIYVSYIGNYPTWGKVKPRYNSKHMHTHTHTIFGALANLNT
jgi:CRISPR/Cas system-associated protein Csx1